MRGCWVGIDGSARRKGLFKHWSIERYHVEKAQPQGGNWNEKLHLRRPEPILLSHDPLDLMERPVLVLVLGDDDLAVLVPRFRHCVSRVSQMSVGS